jgi:hypothetical protein
MIAVEVMGLDIDATRKMASLLIGVLARRS